MPFFWKRPEVHVRCHSSIGSGSYRGVRVRYTGLEVCMFSSRKRV